MNKKHYALHPSWAWRGLPTREHRTRRGPWSSRWWLCQSSPGPGPARPPPPLSHPINGQCLLGLPWQYFPGVIIHQPPPSLPRLMWLQLLFVPSKACKKSLLNTIGSLEYFFCSNSQKYLYTSIYMYFNDLCIRIFLWVRATKKIAELQLWRQKKIAASSIRVKWRRIKRYYRRSSGNLFPIISLL